MRQDRNKLNVVYKKKIEKKLVDTILIKSLKIYTFRIVIIN